MSFLPWLNKVYPILSYPMLCLYRYTSIVPRYATYLKLLYTTSVLI